MSIYVSRKGKIQLNRTDQSKIFFFFKDNTVAI